MPLTASSLVKPVSIFMNTLRLAFGFLMFHRRTIIGILLLIGLYYFITDVVPRISAARRETADNRPKVRTESKQPVEPGNPSEEKTMSVAGTQSTNQIIKSENPDELIKELIRLKDKGLKSRNDGLSLMVAADVIKIAKRLMELPINSDQRKFALGSLAESLLMMRLIKLNSNLADESIDSEFLKKTKELLNDPDPVISSYAAVTIVTSAVFDFHTTPTDDRLVILEKLVDDHFDQIAIRPMQLKRLSQVILNSNLPQSNSPAVKKFLDQLRLRFNEHQEPEVIEVGRQFGESLTFRKLDTDNLVFQLGDKTAESDLKADVFFEALQSFPEASIPIYQTGLFVVREYINQGKHDRAMQLAEKIEKEILPERKDADSRARIQKALDELKDLSEKLR